MIIALYSILLIQYDESDEFFHNMEKIFLKYDTLNNIINNIIQISIILLYLWRQIDFQTKYAWWTNSITNK